MESCGLPPEVLEAFEVIFADMRRIERKSIERLVQEEQERRKHVKEDRNTGSAESR